MMAGPGTEREGEGPGRPTMRRRARPGPPPPPAACLLLLLGLATALPAEEPVTASLNVSYVEPGSGLLRPLTGSRDDGRYGRDSPKEDVQAATVLAPAWVPGAGRDHQGCQPHARFAVPPRTRRWIALLHRGNCTFRDKIVKAAAQRAVAVVISNNVSGHGLLTMAHEGTGNIVAIMISERRGREILNYVERNLTVLMSIAVGSSHSPKYSRGSLVFVSVTFIILMVASVTWLIFYFIQKFRYANLRGRNQRHLGDVANKAIKKLTTRTVKRGDKETDPEFDHCAVCIEGYKSNDVVRILPCKHVFHKQCVDPWLNEHCTCPICKLNILKALGILPDSQCAENSTLDVDRTVRGSLANHRSMPTDVTSDGSINLEPLRFLGSSQIGQEEEFVPRTREMNVTITKMKIRQHNGERMKMKEDNCTVHVSTRDFQLVNFKGGQSESSDCDPQSTVCEIKLPDVQPSTDHPDQDKARV
ncbi:E3 ubiquitin-protein ligase RNF130-like isoform X2 [Narcine bancroftii]|uniref:E3 ubiquitin-protein ligase RNF130-like isoform X2 n=1 Tax=Narcine bancroftii TaxID=1343680 RepID=UPI003831BAE8